MLSRNSTDERWGDLALELLCGLPVSIKGTGMSSLLIRHRVSDIGVWKRVFDEDHDSRQAYGAVRDQVFYQVSDPAEIVVLLEWDDLERARLYGQSDDLRDLFARSGAIGQPGVWVLDDHHSRSGPLRPRQGVSIGNSALLEGPAFDRCPGG